MSDFLYFHFGCASRLLRWQVASVLAAGALFAYGERADASLVPPEIHSFSLDEWLGSATSSDAGSAQATSQESNGSYDSESQRQGNEKDLLPRDAPAGHSSSSSGAGHGGISTSALGSAATSLICGPALAGWVSGELRLALPTPVGNDLLRPPQGV